MKRVLIAGWPRTGKTTLAELIELTTGVEVQHTDDVIDLGWSEASQAVAYWIAEPGPWIIEGVAVPRAIRKALAADKGCPAELLIWLEVPHVELTEPQAAMGKGCDTVLEEVKAELLRRGCRIVCPTRGSSS